MLICESNSARKIVFFRPSCKLWTCPVCGKANARRWARRADLGTRVFVAEGRPIRFITVTSHEKLPPEATIRVLPHAWSLLRERIRWEFPDYEYLIVPERHKDGRLHLHGIVAAEMSKKWLKDAARASGMGFQDDAREVVEAGGVAAYVTKYLTKSLEISTWAKGFHRVRTSAGFPDFPDALPPGDWTFRKLPDHRAISELANNYKSRGYAVVFATGGAAWDVVNGGI